MYVERPLILAYPTGRYPFEPLISFVYNRVYRH